MLVTYELWKHRHKYNYNTSRQIKLRKSELNGRKLSNIKYLWCFHKFHVFFRQGFSGSSVIS